MTLGQRLFNGQNYWYAIVCLILTHLGRCDSILDRNTLLCCSHFGWKFDDLVSGSIDLSNCTLLRRHRTLVNSCDWHKVQLLSEIINVRDDVFS